MGYPTNPHNIPIWIRMYLYLYIRYTQIRILFFFVFSLLPGIGSPNLSCLPFAVAIFFLSATTPSPTTPYTKQPQNHQPYNFFHVTFWSPKWRSLNPWKGHLKHPKRSLGRTWEMFLKPYSFKDISLQGRKLGKLYANSSWIRWGRDFCGADRSSDKTFQWTKTKDSIRQYPTTVVETCWNPMLFEVFWSYLWNTINLTSKTCVDRCLGSWRGQWASDVGRGRFVTNSADM